MKTVRIQPAPTVSVDVLSARSDGPIGTIAIPIRDQMNAKTAMSLLHTDWRWLGPGKSIDRTIVQGNVLVTQRNECIQRMRGDWVLFIDDDMTWEPEAIGLLVASYQDLKAQLFPDEPIMVGGLCVRRAPPYQPTLYMREAPTAGKYNFLERWDSDVVEVDATGMAFVLIEVPVFERFMGGPMPSFEDRMQLTPWQYFQWTGLMGEDIRFCQEAKEKGVRIFVDTRIQTGHVGEVVFNLNHFYQEVALRSKEDESMRRELNTAMGLPTMTAREAKKRLGWTP